MGRILQIICGCVLAATLTGSAQPMQPQQQSAAANQPTKAAEKTRQQRPPVMITLAEPERERQDDHQSADSNAGQSNPSPWYDLWAQGLMAFWAFWQLVLTGAGIYFLRETLKATREAVIDTGEATKAMIAANAIAEEASRGWVAISVVKIGPIWRDTDGKIHGRISYKMKNVGSSPVTGGANAVSFFNLFGEKARKEKSLSDDLARLERSGFRSISFAPGEEHTFGSDVVIPAAELVTTEDLGCQLSCWLGITYATRGRGGKTVKYFLVSRREGSGFPEKSGPWHVSDIVYVQDGGDMH